ncbi:MAG: N-acetylneuraminate synthase family protein [Acidobacteria bacterium]|nr:N-acetylneuraminate synthase family protein [Acidobacteriota bacterium]
MSRDLTIGSTRIHDDGDCYVIAEIGHNHQGSVDRAKEMFRVAKDCGVDAVKLQKRSNRTLYTRAMYESPYDNENSFGATYGQHREALEFGWDHYVELKRYAAEIGITFFATAFDLESADFLAKLDVPAYKIASGDLNNVPLLTHVARIGRPVIISTGGGSIVDVQRAHDAVRALNPRLCLLQCTASYPAEPEDMNLRVITTYRDRFPDAVIGLSDHQNGIALADAAYILGARVIEKHFTLNRASKGTDHAYSLEPVGMRKLVRDLRRVRAALGTGVKTPLAVEKKPLFKMGKKLVAARGLKAGHVLAAPDVAIKSPSGGLPPYELPSVLGRALRRDLAEDDAIAFEDLQ